MYWAQKLESGHAQHAQQLIDERLEALTHPPLVDVSYLSRLDSDDGPYESAQDAASTPSDSSPYEVADLEEEGDDIVAYDTEDSHQMTVADRNRLRIDVSANAGGRGMVKGPCFPYSRTAARRVLHPTSIGETVSTSWSPTSWMRPVFGVW